MKKYTGAGILPIIIINNKPYFICFLMNKKITDAGGKIDNLYKDKDIDDTILNTACRELYEESAGLINIDIDDIYNNSIYFDLLYKNKYYRSYIVLVKGIDKKYYDINLKKLNIYKINPFTETNGIKLINFNYTHTNENSLLKSKLNNRLSSIFKKIIDKYDTFDNLYNILIKKINILDLKKEKNIVNTYEYYTNKKIQIKSSL